MSEIIYKYPLEVIDEQMVAMPEGARILSAQWQGRGLVAWAVVDPLAKPVQRRVRVVGTGNPMPEFDGSYVSTVQEPGRPFVWHVFADRPSPP